MLSRKVFILHWRAGQDLLHIIRRLVVHQKCCVRCLNIIPSRHFGLNYDPSHLVRLGIDYLRFLTEFGDKVNYCHGKDTEILTDDLYETGILPATFGTKYDFSEGSWRYTIPGHGAVEWDKVAVRLDGIGYQGPISIELEDHRYWGTLEKEQQGIIKAKEHLEMIFK